MAGTMAGPEQAGRRPARSEPKANGGGPLHGDGRLVIDAWAGSVNVSAGRTGSVEVALRCWGVLPAPALEIEVSVPPRYSVDVATNGGRVAVHGFAGEVAVRNV